MDPTMLVMKWFHVVAAVIGVGGLLVSLLAIAPLSGQYTDAVAAFNRRFGRWLGICLLVLIATGFYNYLQIAGKMGSTYNAVAGGKIVLVVLLLLVSTAYYHPAKAFERFRQSGKAAVGVMTLLGLLILTLSIWMTGRRLWTPPEKTTPPAASTETSG